MDILASVLWTGRIGDRAAIFVLVNGYPQFIPLDTKCVLIHCEARSHWSLKVIKPCSAHMNASRIHVVPQR